MHELESERERGLVTEGEKEGGGGGIRGSELGVERDRASLLVWCRATLDRRERSFL